MITSDTVDQTRPAELPGNISNAPGKWKAKIDEISAAIPVTRQFRRRIQKLIVKDARNGLQKFTGLQALDANTKQNLQRRVRNYENRLAKMEEGFLQIGESLLRITFLIGVGLWLIYPYIAVSWFKLKLSVGGFVGGSILAMLVMTPPTLALGRVDKLFSPSAQSKIFFAWIAGSLVAYGNILQLIVWDPALFKGIDGFLTTALWTAFGFTTVLAAFLLLFWAIALAWINHIFYLYPDQVITDRLIRVLSLIETNPQRWGELQFKKDLVIKLEIIADCLNRDLPRQLRCDDPVTDAWLAELTIKSAAAIRDLKKWVITPKLDTRGQLIASLTKTLTLAASGNWDGLEKAQFEISTRTRNQRFYRTVIISRKLILAFSPFILLQGFQYTSLALDKTSAAYLTIAAFVIAWTIYKVVSMISSPFSDDVDTVKEFLQLFPFIGKNK